MAHSSDRTLLAALGFADPDKRDRRHTLACQYLCRPEVIARLSSRMFPGRDSSAPILVPVTMEEECGETEPPRWWQFDRWWDGPEVLSAVVEHAIVTPSKYLVGFWDVVVALCYTETTVRAQAEKITPRGASLGRWSVYADPPRPGPASVGPVLPPTAYRRRVTFAPGRERYTETIAIEVKAGRVDVADVARQIELYSQHSRHSVIVVATLWPMAPDDKATLSAKGIRHITLGAAFDEYCESREREQIVEEADL